MTVKSSLQTLNGLRFSVGHEATGRCQNLLVLMTNIVRCGYLWRGNPPPGAPISECGIASKGLKYNMDAEEYEHVSETILHRILYHGHPAGR